MPELVQECHRHAVTHRPSPSRRPGGMSNTASLGTACGPGHGDASAGMGTRGRTSPCSVPNRDTGLHVPLHLTSPILRHSSHQPCARVSLSVPTCPSTSLLSLFPIPSCCHFGVDLCRFGGTGGQSGTQKAQSESPFGARGGNWGPLWTGRGAPHAGGYFLVFSPPFLCTGRSKT